MTIMLCVVMQLKVDFFSIKIEKGSEQNILLDHEALEMVVYL